MIDAVLLVSVGAFFSVSCAFRCVYFPSIEFSVLEATYEVIYKGGVGIEDAPIFT